jgi:hypothetical protein
MKRVLLFAAKTGYQTRVYAEAAERLGMEVLLATDRCHVLDDPWGDRAIPMRFDDPESSMSGLAQRTGHIDGIVAVGDRPAYVAAIAARHLGVAYNSPECVANCGSKYLARQCFHRAGLRLPNYELYALEEAPRVANQYPCVLKPLGLSASRGVIRANNDEEFRAAFDRIRTLLSSPDIRRQHNELDQFIQVESFIEGREFAIEGLVTNGRLRILAIFDKPDPLNGPFFEETLYITPSREPEAVQDQLISTAQRAVSAIQLERGPVHIEMRYNSVGAWILEVAARPIGGLCAKVLKNQEEIILRHAVGEDVSAISIDPSPAGVMMIPIGQGGLYQGFEGEPDARAVAGIEDLIITAKEGQRMVPLPEGSSYLGFLFARAATPAQAESALRQAHAKLHFHFATVLTVVA